VGVVLLWCLGPGASSGFDSMSLSSFCVKGRFFFVASPAMVVAAVCFRPSGLTAADLVSPQTRHLLAVDACSTFKVHHGGGSGCRILRLHQGLTLAAVFGGGLISALSVLQRFGVAAAMGRFNNLKDAIYNFQVSLGLLCKIVRVVLCFY
jgi:hypothetical protein